MLAALVAAVTGILVTTSSDSGPVVSLVAEPASATSAANGWHLAVGVPYLSDDEDVLAAEAEKVASKVRALGIDAEVKVVGANPENHCVSIDEPDGSTTEVCVLETTRTPVVVVEGPYPGGPAPLSGRHPRAVADAVATWVDAQVAAKSLSPEVKAITAAGLKWGVSYLNFVVPGDGEPADTHNHD